MCLEKCDICDVVPVEKDFKVVDTIYVVQCPVCYNSVDGKDKEEVRARWNAKVFCTGCIYLYHSICDKYKNTIFITSSNPNVYTPTWCKTGPVTQENYMRDKYLWEYDEPPSQEGWYAITYCWDPAEGSLIGADYWDGEKWKRNYPIVGLSPSSFSSESEAEKWAEENDCSW